MRPSFTTFGIFILAQLLLWAVSINDNIASGQEILIETIVIGAFVALFFAGYRFARWVAVVLLGLFGLLIASMTFEGFGVAFLSVTFLYAAVIVSLFRHAPRSRREQSDAGQQVDNRKRVEVADVIDWMPSAETKLQAGNTFQVGAEKYRYPLLVKRYQSVMIDFLLLFPIMIVTMVIMGESEARQTVMVSMGIAFALVYEPVLTTYAATLGQYIMGIRVRNAMDPQERINIFQAYIRVVVKVLLGWLSFITINFNPQHRAIHDIAGSSVVVKIK